MMAALAPTQSVPCAFDAIRDPGVQLVLVRQALVAGWWVEQLLAAAPFTWRVEAVPDAIAGLLPDAPPELLAIVVSAARRFAALTDCSMLTVRVEGVVGNACTKVHADYTELRLIQTLAGPGTDYAPDGDPGAPLARVPTGWIGLFKGALYAAKAGEGHAPCLHRSPPIAGSGVRRLVLVIDSCC